MEKSIVNSAGDISPETREKMRNAVHIMAMSLGAYPQSVLASKLSMTNVVGQFALAQEREARQVKAEEFKNESDRFAESHGFADFAAMNDFVNKQIKLEKRTFEELMEEVNKLAAVTYYQPDPREKVKIRTVIPPKFLRKRKY